MSRGGHREGAGRKVGATNLLARELRKKINAESCIAFLQDVAEGRVPEASISERLNAAGVLLKKVLPDRRETEIKGEAQPLTINVRRYIPKRSTGH